MKKLMVALAAVAMVTVGNASVMRWGSGNFYTPTSAKDGTFTSTTISTLNSIAAVLWESTTSFSQLDAGKLYAAYKDGTTATAISGATVKTGANSASANSVTLSTSTSYTSGTAVYAALLYVYDDGAGNTYYIENYAQNKAVSGAKVTTNLATIIGGNGTTSGAAISGWTPVPEPTSGLLLVLGMAGLALKRKRA